MRAAVQGRRGSRAEPGPPSPLTLFNILITVRGKLQQLPDAQGVDRRSQLRYKGRVRF